MNEADRRDINYNLAKLARAVVEEHEPNVYWHSARLSGACEVASALMGCHPNDLFDRTMKDAQRAYEFRLSIKRDELEHERLYDYKCASQYAREQGMDGI